VLEELNVQYQTLTVEDVNRRFKPLHFEGDYSAIYEPQGGTLMANKCVGAFQVCIQTNF